MKKHVFLLLALVCLTLCAGTALAAEAQVGGIPYDTFDQAAAAAADGATVTLLADCATSGLNLSKNLTVDGAGHTLSFSGHGIALWGKALTLRNLTVEMQGIGSTPYAEWTWMAVCASRNASLTLDNTAMTLDGTNTASNTHAIYFCSNNKLSLLNGSTLTIRNYAQDALEWDGGDGGYNVRIVQSSFVSDHNRSGFTGTFVAELDHAVVNVINSTGNGSNGTHFDIHSKSVVHFSDNGAHGLSAGWLKINDSTVTANGNGGNGVHTNSDLTIENGASVTIQRNGCTISSKWTIPGALHFGGKTGVIRDCTLTITDNLGSGLYQKLADGTLTIENSAAVRILRNQAVKLGLGGGVYVNGTVSWPANTHVYNNHAGAVGADGVQLGSAGQAGDDVYLAPGAQLTFAPVGSGWQLDGLPDCYGQVHAIDGWYVDQGDTRWNADAPTEAGRCILPFSVTASAPVKVQEALGLKAAHGIFPAPPRTGDASRPLLWLGGTIFAAAAAVLLIRRRRSA